jgi:ribosomal protein S18 acetylase RimI-like enzyme
MQVIIREAELKDASLLQEFGIKTFLDSFAAANTPENMKMYLESGFSLEKIQGDLGDPETKFLLAYIDQQLAGYAKVIVNKKHEALKEQRAMELERIYVDKQYIGKQVGIVLLEKCFQMAKREKLNVVWLGVWEHNPRAISFYRKWGFEKFSEHTFMLGNDAQTDWLMKKIIS